MENPDLVLQETGSRPTYSRLNYVPSGDTLRRDAISSLYMREHSTINSGIAFFKKFGPFIERQLLKCTSTELVV